MRRFMVHLETDVSFVDGDNVSDAIVENYAKHLAETLTDAAKNLSLRTVNGSKVASVQVGAIKA
jgi:hypothetical protein